MALKLEQIRALADRIAQSHGLDVVDVEYQGGGGKHRTLRVFIEKNEAERAKLRDRVAMLMAKREGGLGRELVTGQGDGVLEDEAAGEFSEEGAQQGGEPGAEEDQDTELYVDEDEDEAFLAGLPSVENLEFLSGITHGDCELFSRDFGTVLEVEELAPGTEYLLEISSPGLDRRMTRAADYRRFTGSLVKVQTFEAVSGNRHWQGRIAEMRGETVVLELGGKPQGKKSKKGAGPGLGRVEIELGNVEKAQLVPEF
jgi:ribosome maturation factor RimP